MPRLSEMVRVAVGAVEAVEVDSGDAVIEEVVALFQGEVDADAVDRLALPKAFATEHLAAKPARRALTFSQGIDAS
jgi:hypothetical protein